MEILNKYKRWKPLLVPIRDKELDFVLSQDNANTVNIDGNMTTKCLVSYIDTRIPECIGEDGKLLSDNKYPYEGAVNNGVILKNIGLTGIDNGTIRYDKGISINEFISVLTGSTLEIATGDTRLSLNTVNGNSGFYEYPSEFISKENGEQYYSFKGGFLQGVYKISDSEYQILPNSIDRSWDMEFVIRTRTDYEVSGNTLNTAHPENKGIFFYMGTRSENKFARFYGLDLSQFPDRPNYTGQCFDECSDSAKESKAEIAKNNREFLYDLYLKQEEEYSCCDSPCGCGGSGKDDEKSDSTGSTLSCDTQIETEEGYLVETNKVKYVKTDNKYLIFDRTKDGFTTDTWKDGYDVTIEVDDRRKGLNLYTLMNRTCSGYTTDNINEYAEKYTGSTSSNYNIVNDIVNNAFALMINDDCSVGYRYMVKDCDDEKGYTILSENTKSDIIFNNTWNVVNVLFKTTLNDSECEDNNGRKMKMYIYVNGYLKFISKELPLFDFRKLNDYNSKQEGVPFNISLGGGTQGMAESMWIDNYTRPFCKVLPLEENFGGTFIGDIRSFKFYDCQLQYNEIKNNYFYEMETIRPTGSTILDTVLYYGFGVTYSYIPKHGEKMDANRNIRNRYTATSTFDDAHFYVVISKRYVGSKPVEFTCGGAPMVMHKRDEFIDGKPCIVYESGAIYPLNTELSILSDNI